jgi:hypothetical protein
MSCGGCAGALRELQDATFVRVMSVVGSVIRAEVGELAREVVVSHCGWWCGVAVIK